MIFILDTEIAAVITQQPEFSYGIGRRFPYKEKLCWQRDAEKLQNAFNSLKVHSCCKVRVWVSEPALQLQLQSLWGVSGLTGHAHLCSDCLGSNLHQALGLLLSVLYSEWKMSYCREIAI